MSKIYIWRKLHAVCFLQNSGSMPAIYSKWKIRPSYGFFEILASTYGPGPAGRESYGPRPYGRGPL